MRGLENLRRTAWALLTVLLLCIPSLTCAHISPAVVGRFLSPDPSRFADSRNLYAYGGNDPVNGYDPDGMLQASPEHQGYDASVVDRVQYAPSSWSYAPGSVNYQSSDGSSLAALLFNPVTQAAYQQMINPLANWGSRVLSGAVVAMLGAIDVASLATPLGDELAGARAEMTAAQVVDAELRALPTEARFATAAAADTGAFSAIGSTGKVGEQWLAQNLGGESQVYFSTSQGGRYVDQLVGDVANESKVGYQSLTPSIQLQISKDAELLNNQTFSGVNWHFFQSPVTGLGGPSQPLLKALQQNGINVIIH